MPSIASRMKKTLDAACQRIDSAKVRPFVKVAAMACEREIVDLVCATMLSSNDMLDVMYQFAVILVEPTILAPLSSTLTDEPPSSGINR